MIKDQSFLDDKASYCIDCAKKNGATDVQVSVGNSVSETVNFRNKKLDESKLIDTMIKDGLWDAFYVLSYGDHC